MRLSPSAQSQVATQVADFVHLTAVGYEAAATPVGQAGRPGAAVVAIVEPGKTDCAAKVAVYHDRLIYTSATGTHVSRPTRQEDAGRIIRSLLSLERR